jgi:hypothetical protein
MAYRILLAAITISLCAGVGMTAPKKARDPNKVICKYDSESGSRLKKTRSCHTQQEWDELRRQTKQNVDRIQNARPWNT